MAKMGICLSNLTLVKFDQVEWYFIKQVMKKMGFGIDWVRRVMMCITSISFAVLINGEPSENFRPSRGLRQGDLLSPYLFLLCTEDLISLISKAAESNLITGVKICRRSPSISHLLFADDNILFYKANMRENRKILSLLEEYENASGKRLNKAKTSISFSKNVLGYLRNLITSFWGEEKVADSTRYLGLPK